MLFLLIGLFDINAQNNPSFDGFLEIGRLSLLDDQYTGQSWAGRARVVGAKIVGDYSIGIGFGLDGYGYNTSPLFFDFRYLGMNNLIPFLDI